MTPRFALPGSACPPRPARQWRCRTALLVAALGWSAIAAPASAEEVLHLCGAAANMVPQATWQRAGLQPGDTGLARDAFVAALLSQLSGVPMAVVYKPARRCIAETAAGQLDGMVGLSPLPERLATLSFPLRDGKIDRERRLNTFAYHWYVRPGEGWRVTPKGLVGPEQAPVVGVVDGYSIATLLTQDGYRVQPFTAGTPAILRMVAKSRLTVAALLEAEATPVMQRQQDLAQQVERLEPAYAVRDYYLVFSPGLAERRPDLTQRLWAVTPQVRETIQRLNLDQP